MPIGSNYTYAYFDTNTRPAKIYYDLKYWNLTPHDNDKDPYEPKKIIFNGPATIVFWKDGTKTVVKCADMKQYNRYNAFCAALAKKIFGTNSKVNRVVKSGVEN